MLFIQVQVRLWVRVRVRCIVWFLWPEIALWVCVRVCVCACVRVYIVGTGYFAEGINSNKAASIQLYRCPPFDMLSVFPQRGAGSSQLPPLLLPPSLSSSLLMDDKNMHAYNSCLFSFFREGVCPGGGRRIEVCCASPLRPHEAVEATTSPALVESIIYCIKNPLVIFETCGRHLSFSLSFSIYILTSIKPTTEPTRSSDSIVLHPLHSPAFRHFVATNCISVEWAEQGENDRDREGTLYWQDVRGERGKP